MMKYVVEPEIIVHQGAAHLAVGGEHGAAGRNPRLDVSEHLGAEYVAELIDLGPGGGKHGGEVVACGRPDEIAGKPESATGRALARQRQIGETRERGGVAP